MHGDGCSSASSFFFFMPLTSEAKELDPSRIITPLKLVMEKYDSPDEVLHS